jgi:hypothetical protein
MYTFFNANFFVIVLFRWQRLGDHVNREHAINEDLFEILRIRKGTI